MSLWFIYLSAFLVMSVSFRIIRLTLAVRKAKRQGKGTKTARSIFWVMTFSYLVFLGCGSREAFHQSRPSSWSLVLAGFFMYCTALLMRELVMRDLGRFFSPDIEIRSGHQVIRQGFYGMVRHPLLVCLIIEVAGLGMALNAYKTLAVIGAGFYLPVILIRKQLEEKALVHQLGEEYRLYQQNVGAFFPKWKFFSGTRRSLSHA